MIDEQNEDLDSGLGPEANHPVDSKPVPLSSTLNEISSQLFFSATKMGTWTWDIPEDKVTWTKEIAQLFGISLKEFGETYASYLQYIHPEDRSMVEERVSGSLEGSGPELEMDHRIIWSDGSIHWIHARGVVVRDGNKQPVQMIGIAHDISEQKKSQEDLRTSEERYKAFIRQSNEGIFRIEFSEPLPLDLSEAEQIEWIYRCCYLAEANHTFAEMYHVADPARMVGARTEYFFPKDQPESRTMLLELVRSKYNLSNWETRESTEQGRELTILNNITGVIEEGKLFRMWGVQRDISARKEMEEALRTSEERFALAVSGSNDGIWDWNILTDALYLSERWKALLGFEPEELKNELASFDQQLHPEDRNRVWEKVRRHLRKESSFYDDEFRMRTKNGTYLWFRSRGQAIWDKNGQAVRMAGSLTDIHDQKHEAQTLLNIAKGVSSEIGERFFRSLVEHLAKTLQAHYAFVGELEEGNTRIRSIAVFSDGQASGNFEYDLADTPCESAMDGKACAYAQGIQNEFPKDLLLKEMGVEAYVGTPLLDSTHAPLGIMVVLFKQPLENVERCTSMLQIFASRASAELERKRTEARNLRLEAQLRHQLERENEYLKEEIRTVQPFGEIVGTSPAIRHSIQQVELVAPTNATVLILGETGSGKEVIARAIHQHSPLRSGPFIKVSCGAIPKELFESEFFGHAKGAFTGAVKHRIGRFELADQGTIFLDEVGEIPFDLQSKLLRVLQEGTFERVGESETRKVNVRVIAATHRDLKNLSSFREDLYYRLSVFPIEVPPLRARKDDLALLANYLIQLACTQFSIPAPQLSPENLEELSTYDFPGNIRELKNIIERAVILSKGGTLNFDLPSKIAPEQTSLPSPSPVPEFPASPGLSSNEFLGEDDFKARQRQQILSALEQTNWKIYGPRGAAEMLGIKPTTLSSRIRRMGLKRPREA